MDDFNKMIGLQPQQPIIPAPVEPLSTPQQSQQELIKQSIQYHTDQFRKVINELNGKTMNYDQCKYLEEIFELHITRYSNTFIKIVKDGGK